MDELARRRHKLIFGMENNATNRVVGKNMTHSVQNFGKKKEKPFCGIHFYHLPFEGKIDENI